MNRRTPLLTTPDLQISRFDHPPGFEHRDPGDEVCDSYEVSFVERGGFHVVAGGRTWQPAAGDMFLTSPGLRYRCYHAEAFPGDVCLTISYRDALKPSREPALTSFAGRPPIVTAPGISALASRHRPGCSRVCHDCGDDRARRPGCSRRTPRGSPPLPLCAVGLVRGENSGSQGNSHQTCNQEHTLSQLARSVGMSTFCFARVFAEMIGVPPHRYLVRLRLQAAAQRLREGASVTETCYAVGFRNLSHFIRCFRRRFGVPPSRYRQKPVN